MNSSGLEKPGSALFFATLTLFLYSFDAFEKFQGGRVAGLFRFFDSAFCHKGETPLHSNQPRSSTQSQCGWRPPEQPVASSDPECVVAEPQKEHRMLRQQREVLKPQPKSLRNAANEVCYHRTGHSASAIFSL